MLKNFFAWVCCCLVLSLAAWVVLAFPPFVFTYWQWFKIVAIFSWVVGVAVKYNE